MHQTFRTRVLRELRQTIQKMPVDALLQAHGSPLLLLDPTKIHEQYKQLQTALPMARHHYAIKALRHPAAVAAVDECGGFFDVMTNSDVDMVRAQRIAPDRCMHTNPIKKPSDIAYAFDAGLRTFVVDNMVEIDKFAEYADRVRLLVRLSFPNPQAKSDLSSKFGAPPTEAEDLVKYALRQGHDVAGFTLHVGSQIHTAQAYVEAITKTTALISFLEKKHHLRLRILDIGGGFPVDYLEPYPTLPDIAKVISPLLRPLVPRMQIFTEPGRYIAAPSMTLFTTIVGKNIRNGKQWYYIDDGLYGTYSSVIYEDVTQPIVALKELHTNQAHELQPSAIAGPTCDSVDVIANDYQLPELEVGDMLVSPMMGAYTAVSATDYNGIPRTPIVVLP